VAAGKEKMFSSRCANKKLTEQRKENFMKKRIYKIFTILNLFIALAALPAYAESPGAIKTDIPFAFTVGETTLPAGKYYIKLPPASGLESRIVISSADGRLTCIALTLPSRAKRNLKKPQIIFTRVGDQYFLSQVYTDAPSIGQKLPLPEAAERLAQTN
jgi:hypothetical protein